MTKEYDVELRNIAKKFNNEYIVKDFHLQIEKGEFVTFLGPSGCGKTTTLNMIAGFLEPDEGEVLIKGTKMNKVPPHKRNLGMVFQTYSIFPHMTVFDNVAYGLKIRKMSKQVIKEKVEEALKLVQLPHLADRFPKQLSGGQRQRVAIARALVMEPSILLLDEPLSNLDAKLRADLRDELKRLHKEIGVTTIFVTHDQQEALSLSDRVVVMNHGRIEQIGTPVEIYHRPATEFVHTFVGNTNKFAGTVEAVNDHTVRIRTDMDGLVEVSKRSQTFSVGEKVTLYLRPEAISLSQEGLQAPAVNCVVGKIAMVSFLGSVTEYHVSLGGQVHFVVQMQHPQMNFTEGSTVTCSWNADDLLAVKKDV